MLHQVLHTLSGNSTSNISYPLNANLIVEVLIPSPSLASLNLQTVRNQPKQPLLLLQVRILDLKWRIESVVMFLRYVEAYSTGYFKLSLGSSNSQDSFQQNSSQSMDGFPAPGTPYGTNQYQSGHVPTSDYGSAGVGMVPSGSMPMDSHHQSMMPNHSGHTLPPSVSATNVQGSVTGQQPTHDSINVQNPFADDIPHMYPRNGMPGSGMHQPGMGASTYAYNHQRPPHGMSTGYAASSQTGPTSPYTYPDQISRNTSQPPPPQGPQSHEQYSDQYRRQPMVNHDGYPARPMSDQYPPPSGASGANYPPPPHPAPPPPPGRNMGLQSNPPSHYGYGSPYDRDR